MQTLSWAAQNSKTPLAPWTFERRAVGPNDVGIVIDFCGVCHSDIHQARDEWGGSMYPMVPGHEIVGRVHSVGASVTRFKKGDLVGVGCMVDSCRTCASCKDGLEQYCDNGFSPTYNGTERDKKTPTQGGYASYVVVDQNFVLSVPKNLDPARVAPLLCAGITTWSPLRHWKIDRHSKVAIVGLGGLGHMGVKLSAALGAHTTVFTTSEKKADDARRLGAVDVIFSKNPDAMAAASERFDFILDTVSAPHDLEPYLSTLKRDGTMVLVGIPESPPKVEPFNLVMKRRTLAGSLIGGIKETQEMLDFCGQHEVMSDIELIPIWKINEAWERTVKSDVRYRFVIDMATLK